MCDVARPLYGLSFLSTSWNQLEPTGGGNGPKCVLLTTMIVVVATSRTAPAGWSRSCQILTSNFLIARVSAARSDTDSGRWTRVADSWVVGERIGWWAMRRGGEPWRG